MAQALGCICAGRVCLSADHPPFALPCYVPRRRLRVQRKPQHSHARSTPGLWSSSTAQNALPSRQYQCPRQYRHQRQLYQRFPSRRFHRTSSFTTDCSLACKSHVTITSRQILKTKNVLSRLDPAALQLPAVACVVCS